ALLIGNENNVMRTAKNILINFFIIFSLSYFNVILTYKTYSLAGRNFLTNTNAPAAPTNKIVYKTIGELSPVFGFCSGEVPASDPLSLPPPPAFASPLTSKTARAECCLSYPASSPGVPFGTMMCMPIVIGFDRLSTEVCNLYVLEFPLSLTTLSDPFDALND